MQFLIISLGGHMKVLLLLKKGLKRKDVSREASMLKEMGLRVSFRAKNPNLAITLGGDGTFFRACRELDSLILPITHTSYGYHCSGEFSGLEALVERFLRGECAIKEYPLLEADTGKKKLLAACDVLFAGKALGPALHMRLKVNGAVSPVIIADGAVAYSYFGSSGYNQALGGPLLESSARALGVSFVNPHNILNRHYVLNEGSAITLEKAKKQPDTKIVIDGIAGYPAERVKVKIAREKARVVRFGPDRLLAPAQH